jgi:hypothetical protein
MPLEGELIVQLACKAQRVQRVSIRSTRPIAVGHLFAGKTPASVAATLPLLFSICASAQGAAAASALAAVRGDEPEKLRAHELDVMLETVQEHFRSLLVDWPEALGREAFAAPVAAVRRRIAAVGRDPNGLIRSERVPAMRKLAESLIAAAEHDIYAMPLASWLALDEASLQTWIERGATLPAKLLGEILTEVPRLGCSDVALMPHAAEDQLINMVAPAMLRQRGFSRAPTWNGAPAETGALARMRSQKLIAALVERCGHSVAVRMTARLVELASLLQELSGAATARKRICSVRLAPGEALSAVETARGLLLHRVRLDDGHVADYQIVAPTEWNFHPTGALARGIEGLDAESEATLRVRAHLAVQALDPCVAYRIEVGHA